MQQTVLLSLLMVVLMVPFSMANMDGSETSFLQKRAATSKYDNPKYSHPMSRPDFIPNQDQYRKPPPTMDFKELVAFNRGGLRATAAPTPAKKPPTTKKPLPPAKKPAPVKKP